MENFDKEILSQWIELNRKNLETGRQLMIECEGVEISMEDFARSIFEASNEQGKFFN